MNFILSDECKKMIVECTGLTFLAENIERNFTVEDGAFVKAILLFYATTAYNHDKVMDELLPLIKEANPDADFESYEEVEIEFDQDAPINAPDKIVTITTPEPITQKSEIVAKQAIMDDPKISDASVAVVADKISLQKGTITGDIDKKTQGNAAIKLNGKKTVSAIIDGLAFNATAYNAIEIGLNSLPTSVIIRNVVFDKPLANNAISVFGMQEGGTILIENCTFKDVSNCIRLSNKTNTHYSVIVRNCTCAKHDNESEYAGIICMQDYTSKTAEDADTNKQFSLINIEIENFVDFGEKLVQNEKLGLAYGVADKDKQAYYVYYDATKALVNASEHPDHYPTVVVK